MASYSWGGPPDDEAPPPKDAPSGFHVMTTDDTAASKTADDAGKKYDWGRTPGSEPMKLKKGFLNVPRHHPLPEPSEKDPKWLNDERIRRLFESIDWDQPPRPTGDEKVDKHIAEVCNRVREKAFGMKRPPRRTPKPPAPPEKKTTERLDEDARVAAQNADTAAARRAAEAARRAEQDALLAAADARDADRAANAALSAEADAAAAAAGFAAWPKIMKKYAETPGYRKGDAPLEIRRGTPDKEPGDEASVLITRHVPPEVAHGVQDAALFEGRDHLGYPFFYLDPPPPYEPPPPRPAKPETPVERATSRRALQGLFDALDARDVDEAFLRSLQVYYLDLFYVDGVSESRETLACRAASLGRARTLERLVRCGADVGKPGQHCATPFWLACGNGHLDCAKLLRKRLGDDVLDHELTLGRTPLHVAAAGGHADVVLWLLETGNVFVDARVDLHAYRRGMKVRLGRPKRDDQGATPLFLAAARGDLDLVGIFLQHGADVDAVCREQTPLEAACAQGHARVAELIASVSARTGKLDGIDPFVVLYASKKTSFLREAGREAEPVEAEPEPSPLRAAEDRIRRDPFFADESAPLPLSKETAEKIIADANERRDEAKRDAEATSEAPKDKFQWRGGFMTAARPARL